MFEESLLLIFVEKYDIPNIPKKLTSKLIHRIFKQFSRKRKPNYFHHFIHRKFSACKQDSNATYQPHCLHPEVPQTVSKGDLSTHSISSFPIT